MVLFRQRAAFVGVAFLVLTASVFYAIVGTRYQANMKVMVRRGRADAPVSAGENAPLDLTRMAVTEEELNSEVELLRDREVLKRVVEETGTGGRDWFHIFHMNEGRGAQVERAARRLAGRLKVFPIRRTNLIDVSYASSDPQKAQRVLSCLSRIYLEKHMSVHRPGGESVFFERQKTESRRELEEAQQELVQFGLSHGVVSAAQQRDLAIQRMSELDSSARQTRIELAETRQKVRELETQISNVPERAITQVRTADNAELLKTLQASMLELQLKRIQLLTKFEPSHRLVREVEQQIEQAESAIKAAESTPLKDETTDKNAHYEWAKLELERANVQLSALQARLAAAQMQASEYRKLTAKLGEDSILQQDLVNRERAAEDNYLLYVKKQEQSRMDDALDERGIVNVVIAEQPAAPGLPVTAAWTVVAIGVVAAGGAGAGAAFVADYLDPGFRNPDDVAAYLQMPVLASLPSRARRRLSV